MIPPRLINLTNIKNKEYKFKNIYALGAIICGTIPFLIILMLTYKNVINNFSINQLKFSYLLLAMAPWYSSFIFIYSGTFFGHLFAGVLMLGAYISLSKKHFFYCGLLAGMSIASEYTLVIIPLIWAIQSFIKEKNIIYLTKMALGALPSFLFILFSNYLITGNPLEIPYQYVSDDYAEMKTNFGFAFPSIKSLFGLSFSFYRGLFIFMPFFIYVLYAIIRDFKFSSIRKYLEHPLVLTSIIYYIIISGYFMWWGGWCYGPRHLSVIAILIGYESVPFLIKKGLNNLFLWITIVLGMFITFASKITFQYSLPSGTKNPISELIIPAFFKAEYNDNNILSLLFCLNNGVSALIWIMLFITSIYFLNYLFKQRKAKFVNS